MLRTLEGSALCSVLADRVKEYFKDEETARSLKSGIKKNTVSRTSGGKHNESKKND